MRLTGRLVIVSFLLRLVDMMSARKAIPGFAELKVVNIGSQTSPMISVLKK